MNKRFLAVVLISMTLLFASVQAVDFFEWDKQLFPEYEPNKEPVIASFASSCIVTGTASKDCATIHYGNRSTCDADVCCYWTTPPAQCNTRDCSHAAIDNPDMCAGCDNCSNTWTIDDDRATTPWDITVDGDMVLDSGGVMIIQTAKTITVEGCVKIRDADALKISGTLKVGGDC